jgi:hypothetical protein
MLVKPVTFVDFLHDLLVVSEKNNFAALFGVLGVSWGLFNLASEDELIV